VVAGERRGSDADDDQAARPIRIVRLTTPILGRNRVQ
jgi:hypothetical protein